jgi:hypothetical protein
MLIVLLVTLTNLLYWSMIESGLALIAACLPTLHYFVARTSFGVSSIRSLLRLDSLRTPFSSRAAETGGASSYSELTTTKTAVVTSRQNEDEVFENILGADSTNKYQLPMVSMEPRASYARF